MSSLARRLEALEAEVLGSLLDRPLELCRQRFVHHLGKCEVSVLLAPPHGDARVEVVDLGGAEGDTRQLLFLPHPDLVLVEFLLESRDLLLRLRLVVGVRALEALLELRDLRLDVRPLGFQELHAHAVRRAHCARVVAQHRHLVVGVIVELGHEGVVLHNVHPVRVLLKLVQLLVERDRSVVCAEHLRAETFHERSEVGVEFAGVEVVKHVVFRLGTFPLNQRLHVLPDLKEVVLLPRAHKRHVRVLLAT
mmetsp:Transcript_63331/g.151519  ORF Transcript_63331/g.151519 Transcript_63331/m.151519 type:complete len:250 (+) Transcript_63331:185-934(+)